MRDATYTIEAQVEATHWWFVVRRHLVAETIRRVGVPLEARVLDIGTSTGTNLRLLRDCGYANRVGLDASDEAIRWCAEKSLGHVKKGDVCGLPFADGEFGLVLATDIIEHVDDDLQALAEIRRVLGPDGTAIITVPAFQSLWGLQDDVAQHKRRYRRNDLLDRLRRTGLRCHESYYFNYLLFPAVWAARQAIRAFNLQLSSENELNTPLLNSLLTRIFRFDVVTARFIHPPFGVSIMAVVSR